VAISTRETGVDSFRTNTRALLRETGAILLGKYERWITGTTVLLALGAIFGKWAGGVIESGLAWFGLAPLAALAGYSLLRAHHNSVTKITGQLDSRDTAIATRDTAIADLQRRVGELEEIGPVVGFHDPESEPNQPMVDGRVQSFAFGCVVNSQKRSGHGETAKDAYPVLTFEGLGGGVLLGPLKGRWRDAPSPIQLPATQHHTHLETIDLRPNGEVRQFDIATKPHDHVRCFAIDSKQNALEVPVDGGDVRVRAVIRGSNFPDIEETFILSNPGYGGSLSVRREPAT